MKRRIGAMLAACLLLTGCTSLLEREYTTVEEHSSRYWEGEAANILRAESYQDLVNDLLLLISAHDESGTVWLYDSPALPDAAQAAQEACDEVLVETPLGAYALERLTYTVDEGGRGYTQLRFTAAYRRTAQQIKAIVHTTSMAALTDLLRAVEQNKGSALTVQVSGFDGSREAVLTAVAAVQQEAGRGEETWQVHFYPDTDSWGIVEIILKE